MNHRSLPRLAALWLLLLTLSTSLLEASVGWETRRLLSDFYAEGAAVGDLNGDGLPDIAYGPFWFAGPDFDTPIRFTPGEPFVAKKGYSDNFFSFIHDCNGDGLGDIVVFGFPGKEVRLYLNPGPEAAGQSWAMHQIADQLCNESPHFIDLIPGGLPEIVGARDTAYGYYQAGDDVTQPWVWHAISEPKKAAKPFGHGRGVGDVNGDGRLDVVEKMRVYLQPESPDGDALWEEKPWARLPYGGGGAQILVDDSDGDGDADLITSLNAHQYGISWFEQTDPGKFARHDIIGQSSTENPYGVAFSQPHALALADFDGDGRQDFVTGKRWMAHQGKDPGSLQAPVLYWFRNVETQDGVEYVPHLIDDSAGVGVEVKVADLNDDGKLDVVSSNKMGLAIHLQQDLAATSAVERWKLREGWPQDGYEQGLSAEEAVKQMTAPEGFQVDLIAAEPDLVQPIAMCFDVRGRIWVIEGNTYPQPAPEGEGKDRILIFEDADADGSFETRKVFAEGINLASGIEVGFGGVWVGAAPYLLFYPDENGDDVPDAEPQVLLDGWGHQDTHETLNSFTWGPDGWLYGCHGVFTHSKVGKPGTPEDEREKLNAGVWRYHPTRHEFEVYAHGTSNPWGVDFNDRGDFFISACVIPHFYHMVQGGRYIRQGNAGHFNPYTFGEIDTIADHQHYAGEIRDHAFWGDNKIKRPAAPTDTSALGGGHAHCGLAIYLGDQFPPEYRGDAIFHNLHGHRMVREQLEHDGSGYTARHRPDFVFANSHDFIGVGVMLGPDGAMYFSDWVDPQTCHHRDVEIWDRSNGRIYRVSYQKEGQSPRPLDSKLEQMSDAELVTTLAHTNAFQARQAQRLLQERAAAGEVDPAKLRELLAAFEVEHVDSTTNRLRELWTAQACGLLETGDLVRRLEDPDPYIRAWALQFLAEPEAALPAEALAAVEKLSAEEESLVTVRYLASMLQRLPHEQRWTIASNLLRNTFLQHDRNIIYLTWYGIEPLVESDPARFLSLGDQTGWKKIQEFILRRAAGTDAGRNRLMTSLSKSPNADAYVRGAQQLLTAMAQFPGAKRPEGWEAVRDKGEALRAKGANQVIPVLFRMGARFGDPEYFEHWRGVARNEKLPTERRVEALALLQTGGDPQLGVLARELIDVRPLRGQVITALKTDPGAKTAEVLVKRLPDLPLRLRNDAINLLATRADMAQVLLRAVDDKQVPASLISPVLLDQFERFEDENITALIDKNWSRGASSVDLEKLAGAIEEWKQKLNPKVMAKADASKGRQVYQMTCGTCHQLFGQGIALGPDLTGSNRADLGYLLENALAPSAVVGKDYMLHIYTLKDGSVVSGMVKNRTKDVITVGMAGGSTTDVKVAEIAKHEELAQSLMPAGLFEALPLEQVADLVKYLGSPVQVAMPGTAPPSGNVPPAAKGVRRIEGETLTAKAKVTGGNLRPQGMGNFSGGAWSGNTHLWWTGAKPGDTLRLTLPNVESGTYDLTLFPTTAKDYGQAKVLVAGQIQEVDFYNPDVVPGLPIHFEKVHVNKGEPLVVVFELTGANPEALARYMVGLDRVELKASE